MTTTETDLPGYEELIHSLADRLEGLSTVRAGLGEAANSLVDAHRELAETKRSIDVLTTTNQGTLDEVRRLRPAELGVTIDSGIAVLRQEIGEGWTALVDRLEKIDAELRSAGNQITAAQGRIDDQLVRQGEDLPAQLSALEQSLSLSIISTQHAVEEALTTAHEPIRETVAHIKERQQSLGVVATDIHKRQQELLHRHETLLSLLTDAQRQQTALSQQLAAVSQSIVDMRGVADTTQSTALAIRQAVDQLGPLVVSAVESTRSDFKSVSGRFVRMQVACLGVVLAAIAIVWWLGPR